MEALIRVAATIAAVLAWRFVWRLTRGKFGSAIAGLMATVASLLIGGAIALSAGFGQAILIRVSDDYAWNLIEKNFNQAGVNIRPLLDADPRIEQEFRREAIALTRLYANNQEALSDAADKMGQALYRKYVGQRAPYGSPASIIEWGQAYLALLERLAAHSKAACGGFAMGRTAEAGKFMPQSGPEMNRLIIAAVAAYKTSDPSNRVPGEKDLEIVWAEIFLGAGAPFTTADLDAFEKIEVLPHPQVCDLMIALLRRVFTLKTEHRVLIIRWLLFEATKI